MCGLLAALFIVVPAVEIALLIEVGGALGTLPTLAVIVITGVIGAALARHQGVAALRGITSALAQGQRVGQSLVEAALVLVAGVLMLTPGFLTDSVGLALLVPPVRAIAARWLTARYARRAVAQVINVGAVSAASARRPGDRRRGPPQARARIIDLAATAVVETPADVTQSEGVDIVSEPRQQSFDDIISDIENPQISPKIDSGRRST